MFDHKKITRREFLKRGAMSGLALAPFFGNGFHDNGKVDEFQKSKGKAKNIIFMVADGMSSGTLTMAGLTLNRQYGNTSNWLDLYDSDRKFHRGLMDMASLTSKVTDSAAAGSSWGCGHRIPNGAINVGPNGEQYPPINQILKSVGKKVGLVTTTRITHATPASFSINIDNRFMEDEIAEKYLGREYDLMMGGGARHFTAEGRDDETDLLKAFSQKRYQIVRNKYELFEASFHTPLLGLFYDSHLPFSIDQESIRAYKSSIPTLAEMTDTALQHLENENGFILQVEGGRVDHAAHGNDAGALIYEQIAFDKAIKVALDYVDKREDTLLIITTDHGNGNPALNGAGDRYDNTDKLFDRLHHFKHSNDWILSELDGNSTVAQIRDRVEMATDIGIEREEANFLKKALNDDLNTIYDIQNSPSAVLGSILANYISVNFTSGSHTGDYVELAALGPGIDKLDHFTRNTELFDLMVQASGVSFKESR